MAMRLQRYAMISGGTKALVLSALVLSVGAGAAARATTAAPATDSANGTRATRLPLSDGGESTAQESWWDTP